MTNSSAEALLDDAFRSFENAANALIDVRINALADDLSRRPVSGRPEEPTFKWDTKTVYIPTDQDHPRVAVRTYG
jgi:hypothetical protein